MFRSINPNILQRLFFWSSTHRANPHNPWGFLKLIYLQSRFTSVLRSQMQISCRTSYDYLSFYFYNRSSKTFKLVPLDWHNILICSSSCSLPYRKSQRGFNLAMKALISDDKWVPKLPCLPTFSLARAIYQYIHLVEHNVSLCNLLYNHQKAQYWWCYNRMSSYLL